MITLGVNDGRRLRIAWCSSTPFPAAYRYCGQPETSSCPWKVELFEHARRAIDAEWLVLTHGSSDLRCDFTADGVRHVVIGRGRRVHNWSYDWRGFRVAGQVLAGWKPDIVHVHGSENYFGLLSARGIVRAPTLIALQGLLNPYVRTVWGSLGRAQVSRIDRPLERLRGTGLLGLARQWRLGARLEVEILRGNRWFAGRTAWDRANLHALNPDANYRTLHEVLRPDFAAADWSLSTAQRHTIFFGNLIGPHKGGDVLVAAVRILRRSFPAVRLRIAGSMKPRGGYARHLLGEISRTGLADNVDFLGYIDGREMARELMRAHVFASAAFMDNSPNAVGEAMMAGVPCVCSYVGGLPSIARDRKEVVFFPAGDPEALAAAIAEVFTNDRLSASLSEAARTRARIFHDPVTTVQELTGVYDEMLQGLRPSPGRQAPSYSVASPPAYA